MAASLQVCDLQLQTSQHDQMFLLQEGDPSLHTGHLLLQSPCIHGFTFTQMLPAGCQITCPTRSFDITGVCTILCVCVFHKSRGFSRLIQFKAFFFILAQLIESPSLNVAYREVCVYCPGPASVSSLMQRQQQQSAARALSPLLTCRKTFHCLPFAK